MRAFSNTRDEGRTPSQYLIHGLTFYENGSDLFVRSMVLGDRGFSNLKIVDMTFYIWYKSDMISKREEVKWNRNDQW